MGPILDYEDKYIRTSKELEKALLEYTPKLFFDFYYKNNEMIIEVPKQIINKVKYQLVPHMGFGMNVRVLERGKYKNKIQNLLNRFRKE